MNIQCRQAQMLGFLVISKQSSAHMPALIP